MILAKLFCLLVVVVAAVYGTHCPHGDISHCGGMVCQQVNETLGCEHDICTCVPKPQGCIVIADCANVHCVKHDEMSHCVDGFCHCQKNR